MDLHNIKIGTWNVQTLRTIGKINDLAEDIIEKNITVTAVQETHMEGSGCELIKSASGEKLNFYYHNEEKASGGGIGFIVRQGIEVTFKGLTSRICKIDIKMKTGRKLTIINCYAPTLPKSNKQEEIREEFYNDLDSITSTISKRSVLFVVGDFNAKTGSAHKDHPDTVGPFGKGHINENGEALIQYAKQHNLRLTNTFFQHKLLHRTTWEAPYRECNTKNKEKRRNPFRNQIDYILTRKENMKQISDSRSYPHNNRTKSDHRPVIANVNLEINIYKTKKVGRNINYDKLRDVKIKKEYKEEIKNNIMKDLKEDATAQERWDNIVKTNKEAAVKILGYKDKTKKSQSEEIKRLSEEQKQLGNKLNSEKSPQIREQIKRARNKKLNDIHRKLTEEKMAKINEQVQQIEETNDAYKMFKAIKMVTNNSKKSELMIQDKDGLTSDPKQQVDIVAKHFESVFTENNHEEIIMDKVPLEEPFTTDEVKIAIKKLKNNKSPGEDEIRAEQLKNCDDKTIEEITEILNRISKGETPKEIKEGLLAPLQKPGKVKGPPANLRPVILLSMLRKILAICTMKRIGEKLDNEIEIEQAAYRPGRGTTEHTFAYKLLMEKALTTQNYSTSITLMDMSKAFDTVRRNTLIKELDTIITPGELNLVRQLIEDVTLKVKIKDEKSKPFVTNVGVPQGDSSSANLFTFYLAKAIQDKKDSKEDHTYGDQKGSITMPHLQDHTYNVPQKIGMIIKPKYADDIGWASNNEALITAEKEKIIPRLKEKGLQINESKTEEYKIKKGGNEDWRKCKILGSLLDTNEDIKRRKQLSMNAVHKFEYIFNDNKLSIGRKIRIFKACVESIFLFNSELWTITKTLEKKIDAFQRRLLRRAINVKWPKKISSKELYRKTQVRKWSDTIKTRRISWYGHALRLPEDTPAKIALNESERKLKKYQGGQLTTWSQMIKRDLEEINVDPREAKHTAQDRKEWRKIVARTRAPCAPARSASQ